MSACRYIVPVVVLAFTGCNGEEGGTRTEATAPATATQQEQQPAVEPSQRRRPVRLLRLGNFNQPTYLTAPRGDRRRFVVEREGRIRVVRGGRVLRRPFLDIADRVQTGGESGLLSMAFARDYRSSRRFWVYYTDNQGFIQIDEFRAGAGTPNRAAPGSRRSVLRVPHFRFNHKGGQIQVGPDGMLYAGFGDGGGGGDPDENGQDLGELLGKLVRIDPRPGGGRSIYAYGLRNPYRFSFDRLRGHLTIGDVGQDQIEEIDFVPGRAGGAAPRGRFNFGWDVFEGRSRFEGGSAPGHVPPVIEHSHDSGFCSITGGYVMRDRSLGRGWYGRYVYGDLCDGTLRVAHLRRPRASTRATRLNVSQLVSFGEDGRGRVYAVSLNGPVYRIGRR